MTTHTDPLRETLQRLKPEEAYAIRAAYYQAVEGLAQLAELLERADAANPATSGGPLLSEHLVACEAIEAMNRSGLGQVL